MSQAPGWYPDPAGVEGRFRYWDGARWLTAVSFHPDGTPAPTPGGGVPGAAAPGRLSRRGSIMVGVVAGAVLLALVIVLAVTIPPMMRPQVPEETTPTAPVSVPATPQSPSAAELNCAGSNGVSQSDTTTEISSTGVTVTIPDTWGFRFDASQWTWLDDSALFGRRLKDRPGAAFEAMFLGGVAARNGFTDPERATADIMTCLTRYGVWNDRTYPIVEKGSEPVTVGGMPGWQRTVEIDEGAEGAKYRLVILVLNSGQPAKFASLTTLAPVDDAAAIATADAVVASVRRQ